MNETTYRSMMFEWSVRCCMMRSFWRMSLSIVLIILSDVESSTRDRVTLMAVCFGVSNVVQVTLVDIPSPRKFVKFAVDMILSLL